MIFDDRKEYLIRLTFAPANEKFVKPFLSYKVKFDIAWNTLKINFYSVIKTKEVITVV